MTKKKKSKDKKRVDLDVRPLGPWFSNFDYGGPSEGGEESPGTGLYHGEMDKSVKEFIDKSRKRKHRKRALHELYAMVVNSSNEEAC